MPIVIRPTAHIQYPPYYLLSSFHTHNTHFSYYFLSPTPPFIPHSFLFYHPMSFPWKFILYQTHFPLSPTTHSTNNIHTILTLIYSTSCPFNHPTYLTYPSPPYSHLSIPHTLPYPTPLIFFLLHFPITPSFVRLHHETHCHKELDNFDYGFLCCI